MKKTFFMFSRTKNEGHEEKTPYFYGKIQSLFYCVMRKSMILKLNSYSFPINIELV